MLWAAPAPFGFYDELARTGLAVEFVSLLALLTVAYSLFRPLAAPRDLPDAELRHAGRGDRPAVTEPTRCPSFKLRGPTSTTCSTPSKSAFVGYRA